jgi:hypothetical protein
MLQVEADRSIEMRYAGCEGVPLLKSAGLGRKEGRMWVFIRPGVVRSANEKRVN